METSFFSILILGFFLGIKHALEPDHIIAVSTIASKSKKPWRSSLAGVYWGISHTLTLFIFGMILIVLKSSISERMSMSLEFLVGIMLVYLGFTSFLSYKKTSAYASRKNVLLKVIRHWLCSWTGRKRSDGCSNDEHRYSRMARCSIYYHFWNRHLSWHAVIYNGYWDSIRYN